MDIVKRLKNRTGEEDTALLEDLLVTAKIAILNRRYPYKDFTSDACSCDEIEVEPRYRDLQYRIALDLYNKQGAEGELQHISNGIHRNYESSWISAQLLEEVTPMCGTTT